MAIIFSKSTFLPSEEIVGSVTQEGMLEVYLLSLLVSKHEISQEFNLSRLMEGSYGIKFTSKDGLVFFTALEVTSGHPQRIRYGFVSEFTEDVEVADYINWCKRLHLTGIQFYDWAYKHEYLTAELEFYGDPLGAQISTKKIKELIEEYRKVGTQSFGYAAVYAVDSQGWMRWSKQGVYDSLGKPFQLGENFLWIVDPADPIWLAHFIEQLKLSVNFGFQAFHLDQYGWPKMAFKEDGSIIDLSVQFPLMLNEIINDLPDSTFIFNNVNDFPTWSTSQTHQAAIYIEVWDPHTDYQHLADLVSKSRLLSPDKAIILSAYLKPFGFIKVDSDIQLAINSFNLCYASIVSGGASHLITGGDGRVLYDPYYVRNYPATKQTLETIEQAFNFTISAGDLLFDSSRVDVTLTSSFGINEEIKFESTADLSPSAVAGGIWVRIYQGASGVSIHFINLIDQSDTHWDSNKNDIVSEAVVRISLRNIGFLGTASVGSMGTSPLFTKLLTTSHGEYLEASIDLSDSWTIVNFPMNQASNPVD